MLRCKHRTLALGMGFFLFLAASAVYAAPAVLKAESAAERLHLGPSGGTLLAQLDDTYDPFSDYSEYEESIEEEEDINFFRNGRLLTVGLVAGYRGWTQNLARLYSGNVTFGLMLTYFFDLRFALQFGLITSDHALNLTGSGFEPVRGTVGITDISFNIKYFLNTQNVTRGLAELSPYILLGFSQVYRTTTVSGNDNFAKDSAFAFNVGAGIEIPIMRNKMFLGLGGHYQYIMFSDENNIILDENDTKTGFSPYGDSYVFLASLGVNF